jgi:hypothetical protein
VTNETPPADPTDSSYQKRVLPFLTKYCTSCHGSTRPKADLSFDKYKDDPSVLKDRKTWDTLQHMLKAHEMPAKGLKNRYDGPITRPIGCMVDGTVRCSSSSAPRGTGREGRRLFGRRLRRAGWEDE